MKKTTLRLVSGAMGILMALSFTACNEETIAAAVNGKDGSAGEAGKSAFELYCEANGYEGTEEQWLDDLISGRLTPKTQVTLKFNSNGGSKCDDIVLDAGSSTTLPVPTKDGYYFAGWYVGEGANKIQVTNLTAINADMTLVAEWSTVPTFIMMQSAPESIIMLGDSADTVLAYSDFMSAHELQEKTTITINYNGKDYTYGEAYRNDIVSIHDYYDFIDSLGLPVLELSVYPALAGDYKVTVATDRAEYTFAFTATGYSIKSSNVWVCSTNNEYRVRNGADIIGYTDDILLDFEFDAYNAYDIYNSASPEDFDISAKIDGQEVEVMDVMLDAGYLYLMVDLANAGTTSKSTVSVTVSKDGESATSTVTYQKLDTPADAEQRIVTGLQNAALYSTTDEVFQFHTYTQFIQGNGATADFTLTAADGTDMASYFTVNDPNSDIISSYGITITSELPVGTYTLTGTLKNTSGTVLDTTTATITVLEPVEITASEEGYIYVTAGSPAELVFTVNKEITMATVYLDSRYTMIPLFKPNTEQTRSLPGMEGTTATASYTVSNGKTTITVKINTIYDNLFCFMTGGMTIDVYVDTTDGGEGASETVRCMTLPTSIVKAYLPSAIYSLETYFSDMLTANEELKAIYDDMKKVVADTKLSDIEKFVQAEVLYTSLTTILSNMEIPADFDIDAYEEQIKAKISKKITVDDELKGTFIINITMGSTLYDITVGTPLNTNAYTSLLHMGEEEYLLNNTTDAEILETVYELLSSFSTVQGGIITVQIPGYAKGLSAVEQARNAYHANSTPESFEAYENALLDLMYISKMPI